MTPNTVDEELDAVLTKLAEQYQSHEANEPVRIGELTFTEQAIVKLKALIEAEVRKEKKEQARATSNWIKNHIRMLHKDPAFNEVSGWVALTYAEDQARQGYRKSLELQEDSK